MNGEDLKFLARRAESVAGRADQRLDEVHAGIRSARRRRAAAVAGAATAAVLAVVVGIFALTGPTTTSKNNAPPAHSGSATPHAEPTARKLVYVDSSWPMRKIHVGDQTVDISDQLPPRNKGDDEWGMVFLQVSGDGVVLLTHDGRVWFTDGNEIVRIGQTGSPTRIISLGALKTGMSGSIAAWVDGTGGTPEMFVFNTTQRAEVARVPCPKCGEPEIAGNRVYWEKNGDDARNGPWVMFDPETGETRRVPATAYAEDLVSQPRALIVGDSQAQGQVGTGLGQEFLGVDDRLVPLAESDQPGPVFTKAWDTRSGKQLDLRIPTAYDGQGFRIFDWLDDDRIALEAHNDRNPDRVADLLVCRISTGGCRVAVPGTQPRFVANIGFD
jgi:hypothetical protein